MKKKLKNVFSADFETTTIEPVKVWLWAICDKDATERNEVKTGESLTDFMMYLFKKATHNTVLCYFFNLKFDGTFIVWWLFKNKFKQVKDVKDLKNKTFYTLMDEKAVLYQIKIKYKKNILTFQCSYRLCLSSLKDIAKAFNCKYQKSSIDYDAHNTTCQVNDEEIKYIQEDVLIQADFLKHYYNNFKSVKLTIGGQALYEYKQIYKEELKNWWCDISPKKDTIMRGAYRGGICFLNKKYQNKIIECNGAVYDYNSMYPSMLHSASGNKYPIGNPVYFKNEEYDEVLSKGYKYIIRFSCKFKLKKGFIPCVCSMGGMYNNTTWETESKTQTDLTLCDVDLMTFLYSYDVKDFYVKDGFYFEESVVGIADKYINKFYEMKKNEKGAKRIFAKYMLNSLTGKFGSRIEAQKKYFKFISNNEPMELETEDDERSGVYLPWVIYITAYARQTLCLAINKNYDNFIYCDTDSIHLLNDVNIDLNTGTELLQWKKENKIIKCKYIRTKAYIDKTSDKEYNIKIAGLPEKSRINTHDDKTFDYYYIGAIFKNVKLIPKLSVGGVRLVETDFTLKDI